MPKDTDWRRNAASISSLLRETRERIARFECWFESVLADIANDDSLPTPPAHVVALLTPRQLDMLAAIAGGQDNKTIARRLGISESSVKVHCAALYKKIGAKGRATARMQAVAFGALMNERNHALDLLRQQAPISDEMGKLRRAVQ